MPIKANAKRRVRRKPAEIQPIIYDAALAAFTKNGFTGATMRSIARDAGLTVQLLTYHVKSKQNLWKLTISNAFDTFNELYDTDPLPADASAKEKLRRFLSGLVSFDARMPMLLRIMLQEGGSLTPRSIWLAETRTKALYDEFCNLARDCQKAGEIRSNAPIHRLFYAVIAIAALPFSVAAEYEYLTGKDPFSKGEIKRTMTILEELLFT